MTHHAPTPPPPAPAATAEAELPRWTLERMGLFIDTLRRTRNVAAASRAAGMSRKSAYALRARLAGHPFVGAWDAALAPRRAFQALTRDYRVEDRAAPSGVPRAGFQGETGGDGG